MTCEYCQRKYHPAKCSIDGRVYPSYAECNAQSKDECKSGSRLTSWFDVHVVKIVLKDIVLYDDVIFDSISFQHREMSKGCFIYRNIFGGENNTTLLI